jgi:hypothetical protein
MFACTNSVTRALLVGGRAVNILSVVSKVAQHDADEQKLDHIIAQHENGCDQEITGPSIRAIGVHQNLLAFQGDALCVIKGKQNEDTSA